jgi:hypothetical protein
MSCSLSHIKEFCGSFPGIFRELSMPAVETLEITLSVNDQTGWYLDRLIETGLYGNKRAEAAKIVILDHCKLLIAQEKLKMAPPITEELERSCC